MFFVIFPISMCRTMDSAVRCPAITRGRHTQSPASCVATTQILLTLFKIENTTLHFFIAFVETFISLYKH